MEVEVLRQQARGKLYLVAGVVAVSVVAACDAHTDQPITAPAPSASPIASSTTTITPVPSDSSKPSDGPPLVTAAADKVLAPQVTGTGPGRTSEFTIAGGIFTVRVACSGDGTAKLSVDGDSYDIPCNEVTRRVHVATESKRATAQIAAAKSQRWTMVVVVTDDIGFATSKPTTQPR